MAVVARAMVGVHVTLLEGPSPRCWPPPGTTTEGGRGLRHKLRGGIDAPFSRRRWGGLQQCEGRQAHAAA